VGVSRRERLIGGKFAAGGLHKQVLRIAGALHYRCGIAAGALALFA